MTYRVREQDRGAGARGPLHRVRVSLLPCLLVLLTLGCAIKWKTEEKSAALADGFCAEAKVAGWELAVGHCAPAEDSE